MARPIARDAGLIQTISLRQLRFFVTLAQVGHFGRAAERVAVSQPALSAAIRQIEIHLGVRLFERTTHSVALTPAGSALLLHAQRLLTTAENAFADMREATQQWAATVRIGAVPSIVATVAEVIAAPGRDERVSVHLHDGKSNDLLNGLRTGAFDLVASVSTTPDAEFETIALAEDEMLALVRADHPRLRGPRISWRSLAGEEIVHFVGGGIGELSAAALGQNGLVPSSRYRVDQVDSLYGLVMAGLAVGVMPRLYARALDPAKLHMIPLIRPTVRRPLKLLFHTALRDEHPLAHAFAHSLAKELQQKLAQR
jgi:DNA-binding transcriptional LysR family regulator